MNILNVMQGTNLGGMEQASLRLMAGLQRRGHRCEVISLNPVGALGPLLEREGIEVTGLPYRGRGGWRSLPSLRRALQGTQADALMMTGHNLLGTAALGNMCAGRRVLAIHFHHQGVKPRWQWRLIYRVACSRFNAITFPSEFVRNEAEALFPQIRRMAHTVRNPLSVPAPSSTTDRVRAREALGVPLGAPVVGNAGWLIPRKRFDVFLTTASEVARRLPDALFLIAGDGEQREVLRSLANELGIAARVRWLGWQADMVPFFRSIDVMLFNSDWDAMGLAPLEAMSHGVPVVASVLHGGLREIIASDRVGYLLSQHDVPSLTEKVVQLLSNAAEARAMGIAGRERVGDVSDVGRAVQHVEALLAGQADV